MVAPQIVAPIKSSTLPRQDLFPNTLCSSDAPSSPACHKPSPPPLPKPVAAPQPHKPMFVISVCDGIGGIFVALRGVNVAVQGIAVEKEAALRSLTHKHFPELTLLEDMMTTPMSVYFDAVIASGTQHVLFCGGVECSPFSALGSRKEMSDPRSCTLTRFITMQKELGTFCEKHRLCFSWILENVASMSAAMRSQISSELRVPPVLVHAADFGWTHRARLFWCSLPSGVFSNTLMDLYHPGELTTSVAVLRWKGPKMPSSFQPPDGFHMSVDAACGRKGPVCAEEEWTPSYPSNRFLTFTRCFKHPADRLPATDKQGSLARFEVDQRRFQSHITWRAICCGLETSGAHCLLKSGSIYTASLLTTLKPYKTLALLRPRTPVVLLLELAFTFHPS